MLLAACGGKESAGGDGAALTPKTVTLGVEARQKWEGLCVTCHGKNGEGDGAAGASLNPKPQSFWNEEWQNEVTDEELAKVILEGGQAVGKSPLMPGNPDLKGKDDVVAELVEKVRSFRK